MIGIVALLMAVTISTTAFGQALAQGPLPPGRPAGVRRAMSENTEGIVLAGMLAVGLGICAVAVAGAGKSSNAMVTTSTSR